MSYLDDLNSRQREAVLHAAGPLLVVAGAGAGKTKTITYRILHLIKTGTPPEEILALTFTNKAAKEMADRVRHLLNQQPTTNYLQQKSDGRVVGSRLSVVGSPWIGTFHGLAAMLLREHANILGIPKHFKIFDRDDSKAAVRQAMKTAGIERESFEPGRLLAIISREKGNAVTREAYAERVGSEYVPQIVASVWEVYEQILKGERALDFDDLLLSALLLLRRYIEVKEKLRKRWRHIHIDEYQDTNRVQYELTRLLVGDGGNICVVGDVDQSIYSWRGAEIQNLLAFEKDYPTTRIVLLEENYRSTKIILEAANRIIAKNRFRHEKNLFTKNQTGEKISVYAAENETDEAAFVAAKAGERIAGGVSPREIAILYRANFQSRALEEAMLHAGIPYQVIGVRFFERKEVKDALSYLRAALDPANLSDWKRALTAPSRGIGKVTLLKVLAGKETALPPAMRGKISAFRSILREIKEKAEREPLSAALRFIVKRSGIEEALATGEETDDERLENIRELVTFAARYDGLPRGAALEEFLADVALASDQDELKDERDAVRLMTVHAAKGLEFDVIFVTGLEEDLFPHKRAKEESISESDAEEERRLFYVALTRARRKLYLSYASSRTIFGTQELAVPSEFLVDIPENTIEEELPLAAGGKRVYLD